MTVTQGHRRGRLGVLTMKIPQQLSWMGRKGAEWRRNQLRGERHSVQVGNTVNREGWGIPEALERSEGKNFQAHFVYNKWPSLLAWTVDGYNKTVVNNGSWSSYLKNDKFYLENSDFERDDHKIKFPLSLQYLIFFFFCSLDGWDWQIWWENIQKREHHSTFCPMQGNYRENPVDIIKLLPVGQ